MITIIGILIALLLPAVQAAREAARQLQCKNNLKQMALACLDHEHVHGFFPTGGWAWRWAGDPDRGFDRRQPGGWHYNILPYIEQEALHDLGLGGNLDGGRIMAETPVAMFICPTRRQVIAYPYPHDGMFFNINRPRLIGRSDYAANGGSTECETTPEGPSTYPLGDGYTEQEWMYSYRGCANEATGPIYRRSECKMADVADGTSCTYLIGERYLNPFCYEDGTEWGDDQGWVAGFDYDTNRWCWNNSSYWPRQDQEGYSTFFAFGSAHGNGFHMALCDGSAQMINYTINPQVHECLGNRKDGYVIDAKAF